ncbi:helix-turn-helix transcriptional regulator [Streptomyces lavendulocolor]|uniref:helix-turn-helix transcriptional regulator n=1 Tax=Streptomyces lavendulocolor TaxID=67316 RepID=UPI003C2F12D8
MPADPPPAWVFTRRAIIGGRLRQARLDAGLTQWALADLVSVDHKTIHRVEHGTSDPSLGLLLRIADAVDVPLAHLVR